MHWNKVAPSTKPNMAELSEKYGITKAGVLPHNITQAMPRPMCVWCSLTEPHTILRSVDSTHSHTGAEEPSVEPHASQTLTETSQTSAVASSSFILWKRPFVTESHSEANQPYSPHWSEGFFSWWASIQARDSNADLKATAPPPGWGNSERNAGEGSSGLD